MSGGGGGGASYLMMEETGEEAQTEIEKELKSGNSRGIINSCGILFDNGGDAQGR